MATVYIAPTFGVGFQAFTAAGLPLSGGLIYTYAAGTTTPQATYTASDGVTPNANPIVLGADGRPPNEIWLTSNSYRFDLKDSLGNTLGSFDNIPSGFITAATLAASGGSADIGFLQSGSGAVAGTVQAKLREVEVSVLDFTGVDSTGASDSSAGIQNALNNGAKRVRAPAGTYKLLSTITVPDGVSFYGDGIDQTIFDCSSATFASLTEGSAIRTAGGSWTAISALSADVTKDSRTLTFSSAHGLAVGDVICIYNATNGSFSAFRTYYRAGELLRVARVNSTTQVTTETTLADSYTAASVSVYKLAGASSCKLRDFTIKALDDASNATYGIRLNNPVDSAIENVRSYNASYGPIYLNNGYGIALNNCYASQDFTSALGGDYGLIIGNCTKVDAKGGSFAARRHGVAMGGEDGTALVSNRYCYVEGALISTNGDANAANIHGNAEFCGYINCVIDGGVVFGGDNITIKGNTIRGGDPNTGSSVVGTEWRGCNHTIEGNSIETALDGLLGRGAFLDVGGASSTSLTSSTTKGGTIAFTNNKMRWRAATADSLAYWGRIDNRGYVGSESVNLVVSGNSVEVTTGYRRANFLVEIDSGNAFETVKFTNNTGFGVAALDLANSNSPVSWSANFVYHDNNSFDGGFNYPCLISSVQRVISFKGNTLTRHRFYASLSGNTGLANCDIIHAEGNALLDNLRCRTGNSNTDTPLYIHDCDTLVSNGNVLGGRNEILFVASNANIVIGETLTGATSGATAVVTDKRSTTEVSIDRSRTGTFTGLENLNGSSSGLAVTTAAATPTADSLQKLESFNIITTLSRGNNVAVNPGTKAYFLGSVTTHSSIDSALRGSATYDPPSLADGAGTTTTVTVTNAALGDFVDAVSFSLDLQGITLTAWVSAANTVSVRFQNESGGVLDLASGTLAVRVRKA